MTTKTPKRTYVHGKFLTSSVQKNPVFNYPTDETSLYLEARGWMLFEGYFINEPNWILKSPKLISEHPIKMYLATQLGNTHLKKWCHICKICFVFYHEPNEDIIFKKLECLFCKYNLLELPKHLRKKYNSEMSIQILSFKAGLGEKRMTGNIIHD
ncbi:MAG: hypothetical protein ACFE9L_04285 [Candidatus Hodarchaeota archaeon]